jgi:hypothetical protein
VVVDYIVEILTAHHQDALFKGWVSLQAPDKALRDRILVVSNFRIIALKVGEDGPQVNSRFSSAILCLIVLVGVDSREHPYYGFERNLYG